MRHIKILTILFLFLLSACNHTTFEKIKIENGGYKLLFYTPISSIEPDSVFNNFNHSFIKKHGNFYIDKIEILKDICKFILKPPHITTNPHNGQIYIVQLVKNGGTQFGGILELNNNILISEQNYDFDLERFESYSKEFKRLNIYTVKCYTFKEAKKLFNVIKKNNIFVPNENSLVESKLLNCKGHIKFFTYTSYLKLNGSSEEIQNKILNEFKPYDKSSSIVGLNYLGGDSIFIDIAFSKDISKCLPINYHIVKAYNDSLEIPINVCDVEKEKLFQLLMENKINAEILEVK